MYWILYCNLKNEIDKLDVDKLVPVPVDLRKLSHAVKNDAVKKDVYIAKIKNIEDKISSITNVATKTTLFAKTSEAKGEIRTAITLATKTALTAVENKITKVSNLRKQTDYNTKTNEIEKKITNHNHDFVNLIR